MRLQDSPQHALKPALENVMPFSLGCDRDPPPVELLLKDWSELCGQGGKQ